MASPAAPHEQKQTLPNLRPGVTPSSTGAGGQDTVSPPSNFATPLSNLPIPQSLQLDLEPDDFQKLNELDLGRDASISLVLHKPTNTIMACKTIYDHETESVRKQALRELQIMYKCNSPFIVPFFGAFVNERKISICMEFMNCGSLGNICNKIGPVPEDVAGQIAHAVLSGLAYLHNEHQIIHNELKPSNILLDSAGHIKLADFQIPGQWFSRIALARNGTSLYISLSHAVALYVRLPWCAVHPNRWKPERIQGSKCSAQSDVWSLGMIIMELVLGRFPFPPDGRPLSVFEMLEYIVYEPVPTLPPGQFSEAFEDFIARFLIRDPTMRPTPSELLTDPFCVAIEAKDVDMAGFAKQLLKES
ncbi:MAP kinase kinase (MEK) [Polyrhizophydium stewartii]|uniref:MAP kinase kinase (MEK) n=1 Tax=Polyrhizophydium stewartii TaxID=2732419 RepID=A0ABR4MX81_9FUNG